MNALTLGSLAGAVERQGGAGGRARRQLHVRPFLGQPDRVATLGALRLEQPRALLFRMGITYGGGLRSRRTSMTSTTTSSPGRTS
jgi:hypothetical protein